MTCKETIKDRSISKHTNRQFKFTNLFIFYLKEMSSQF